MNTFILRSDSANFFFVSINDFLNSSTDASSGSIMIISFSRLDNEVIEDPLFFLSGDIGELPDENPSKSIESTPLNILILLSFGKSPINDRCFFLRLSSFFSFTTSLPKSTSPFKNDNCGNTGGPTSKPFLRGTEGVLLPRL